MPSSVINKSCITETRFPSINTWSMVVFNIQCTLLLSKLVLDSVLDISRNENQSYQESPYYKYVLSPIDPEVRGIVGLHHYYEVQLRAHIVIKTRIILIRFLQPRTDLYWHSPSCTVMIEDIISMTTSRPQSQDSIRQQHFHTRWFSFLEFELLTRQK